MTDQYRLLAGITTGRIDTDDYGSFEIQSGECTVDDYEAANALVNDYRLSWFGDDPGPPESESDDESDAKSEDADAESEDAEAEAEEEANADAEDEDGEGETESEPEADADSEDEIERDDEGREIYTCAGMDGDCTRRVDEPGGLCWQHED